MHVPTMTHGSVFGFFHRDRSAGPSPALFASLKQALVRDCMADDSDPKLDQNLHTLIHIAEQCQKSGTVDVHLRSHATHLPWTLTGMHLDDGKPLIVFYGKGHIHRIGKGSAEKTIYKGIRYPDGKPYVIMKCNTPSRNDKLVKEALTLHDLASCLHIPDDIGVKTIPSHKWPREDGHFSQRSVLLMPYFDGGDMESAPPVENDLHSRKSFCKQALDLCQQLAEVHRQGKVHWDIKPANIFLSNEDHRARLMDYGVAGDQEQYEALFGNLMYAPPEFAIGALTDRDHLFPISRQKAQEGDIYALGSSLLKIFTGRPHWVQGHIIDCTNHGEQPADMATIEAKFEESIDYMLQLNTDPLGQKIISALSQLAHPNPEKRGNLEAVSESLKKALRSSSLPRILSQLGLKI